MTAAQPRSELDQPVAVVSPEDVERLIRREFGGETVAAVCRILEELPSDRLRAAALMLAGGDLMTLSESVGAGLADARDLLAPAEYRDYCALPLDASLESKRDAVASDAARYQAWLER